MSEKGKYRIRFFLEWGFAWLWAGNDVARETFGYGPIENKLPISEKTKKRAEELYDWYRSAINYYPPDPILWRQEECNRFKIAARAFFADLQNELGDTYELVYEQHEPDEDPDLDAYLNDPDFRRLSQEKVIGIVVRQTATDSFEVLAYRTGASNELYFPSGLVKPGETREQAVLKCIREQVGLNVVQIIRILGHHILPETIVSIDGHPRVMQHYQYDFLLRLTKPISNSWQYHVKDEETGEIVLDYQWIQPSSFHMVNQYQRTLLDHITSGEYLVASSLSDSSEMVLKRRVWGKKT